MITKDRIIEIMFRYSYKIEDHAGCDIIVVDSDDWEDVADEIIKLTQLWTQR